MEREVAGEVLGPNAKDELKSQEDGEGRSAKAKGRKKSEG